MIVSSLKGPLFFVSIGSYVYVEPVSTPGRERRGDKSLFGGDGST